LILLAGIDGGGSKTLAIVASNQGFVLGRGWAGSSNPNLVGIAGSIKNLRSALIEALSSCESKRVKVAVFGIAGSEAQRELSKKLADSLDFVDEVEVMNDSFICLAAGTLGKPGVVVVAGTGSITLAIDEKGKVTRAGGWGYLLEDEGSGLQLGREAVLETLRYLEGRASSSRLVDAVLKKLGAREVNDLLSSIYGSENPVATLASFAPLVVQLANEGDPAAMKIVDKAAEGLVSCVASVISRSSFTSRPIPVVLSGGVFKGKGIYLEIFRSKLSKVVPEAEARLLELEPAVGALILAFKKTGLLSNQVLSNLIESYQKMGGSSDDRRRT